MSMIPQAPKKSAIEYDVLDDKGYPARITRFIGLGVQDQPAWNGQQKAPAFKAGFEFEIIGVDTSGTITKNGKTEPLDPKPACVFTDMYLFPNAERGKVFDLCQAVDPSIKSVPGDLSWFIKNLLGKVVSVRVGSYTNKAGQQKNKVVGVDPIPEMFQSQVGPARRELLGFDPYVESDDMFSAYQDLFNYQRDILAEAHDSANIVYAGKEVVKQDVKAEKQADPEEKAAPKGEIDFDEDSPF